MKTPETRQPGVELLRGVRLHAFLEMDLPDPEHIPWGQLRLMPETTGFPLATRQAWHGKGFFRNGRNGPSTPCKPLNKLQDNDNESSYCYSQPVQTDLAAPPAPSAPTALRPGMESPALLTSTSVVLLQVPSRSLSVRPWSSTALSLTFPRCLRANSQLPQQVLRLACLSPRSHSAICPQHLPHCWVHFKGSANVCLRTRPSPA